MFVYICMYIHIYIYTFMGDAQNSQDSKLQKTLGLERQDKNCKISSENRHAAISVVTVIAAMTDHPPPFRHVLSYCGPAHVQKATSASAADSTS